MSSEAGKATRSGNGRRVINFDDADARHQRFDLRPNPGFSFPRVTRSVKSLPARAFLDLRLGRR